MQKGQFKRRRVCTLRRDASGKLIGSKSYEHKNYSDYSFWVEGRNYRRLQRQPQMHILDEDLDEVLSQISPCDLENNAAPNPHSGKIRGAGFDENGNFIINFCLDKILSDNNPILAEDYKTYCINN